LQNRIWRAAAGSSGRDKRTGSRIGREAIMSLSKKPVRIVKRRDQPSRIGEPNISISKQKTDIQKTKEVSSIVTSWVVEFREARK
jgi:hypothetical protein